MKWIKTAWQGREKLYKVFWGYFVLLPFLLFFLSALTLFFVSFLQEAFQLSILNNAWLYLLSRAIYMSACLFWLIWVTVSVWRSGANTNHLIWGYLSKVSIALFHVYLLVGLARLLIDLINPY